MIIRMNKNRVLFVKLKFQKDFVSHVVFHIKIPLYIFLISYLCFLLKK